MSRHIRTIVAPKTIPCRSGRCILPPQTKLTDVGVVEAGEDAELSVAALGVVDAGLAEAGGALGAVGAGVGAEVTDVSAAGGVVSGGALDAGGSVATGEAGI